MSLGLFLCIVVVSESVIQFCFVSVSVHDFHCVLDHDFALLISGTSVDVGPVGDSLHRTSVVLCQKELFPPSGL